MNNKLQKLKKILVSAVLALAVTAATVSFAYAYYYDDDYPEIYNAYWDNHTARWDVNGYATKFEIRLYKDGHHIVTRTTTQDGMNMSQYFNRGSGDYYFDVRPYYRYGGWGNWTASDSIYMDGYYYDDYHDRYYDDWYYDDRYYYDRDYRSNNLWNQDISYARNDGPPINQSQSKSNVIIPKGNNSDIMPGSLQQNQTAGINAYNKQVLTVPTSQVIYQQANGESSFGKFVEVYGLWHYIYDNGAPATNAWVQYKNKWYYIDMNGVMATGLYTINGTTYYLNTDGSMAVGTLVLDGITHFFDNNGAMIY